MTTTNAVDIGTCTSELLCSIRERVAVVMLNRPEARNALSDRLIPALSRMVKPPDLRRVRYRQTQLDLKFCRDHPARFDEPSRRTVSSVVSIQMPTTPTDRLFYMTLLRAVGAVFSPRISTLSDRDNEWMHVGLRPDFPHDSSGAADMIRVAVSENQMLKLVWRTVECTHRSEDGG